MPNIEGIDRITYGVEDIAECKRFFLDWGLRLVREDKAGLDFESLNGCEARVRKADDPSLPAAVEPGPTLREVIWGVAAPADLEARRTSRPLPVADAGGQARPQSRGLHCPRHARGDRRRASSVALRLGDATRPGPAPDIVGAVLVLQESGGSAGRVLRRRRRADRE